jgi:hypothetical protein
MVALVESNCSLVSDDANAGTGTAASGASQRAVRRLNVEVGQFLASTGMMMELIRAMLPSTDSDAPGNAVATVGMLLAVVAPKSQLVDELSGPVALTLVLESLQYFEKSPPSFQAGVDVSVMIMCCKKFDKELVSSFAPEVWCALEPHVHKLATKSERLGVSKYALVQLCSALTLINEPAVDVGLKAVHLPRIFTNLVCQFPRNNMLHSACGHFFMACLRGSLQSLCLCDEVAGLFIARLADVFDDWPVAPDRGFLVQFCLELLNLRESTRSVEEYLSSNSNWTPELVGKITNLSAVQKGQLGEAPPAVPLRSIASSLNLSSFVKKVEQNSPVLTRVEMDVSEKEDPFSDANDVDDDDPFGDPKTKEKPKVVEVVVDPKQGDSPKDFAAPTDVAIGDFAAPKEDVAFGDFAAPKDDVAFGDFAAPKEDVAFGDFAAPKEDVAFGDFAAPKEDVAFGDFAAPKEDVAFGDFAAPKEDVAFGDFAAPKEDVAFGDFAAPKEDVAFGDFAAPKEDVAFGDFAAPKDDVAFGDFAAPKEDVAFGDFAAPKEVDAPKPEFTKVESTGWAAFDDEKTSEVGKLNGLEEGERARRMLSKVFFANGEGKLESLALLWSDLNRLKIADGGSSSDGVSKKLLMETLDLKEPVVVSPPPEPVVVHQPTPPPVRLTPAPAGAAAEKTPVPPAAEKASVAVAPRDLTSEDFGFLSSFGQSTGGKKATSAPSSAGLDLLFATTPSVQPSQEQMRQAALSEVVGSLTDLSFMLADSLSLPQQRSVSLLDFL